MGLRSLPGFPYINSQAVGGYIGVTMIAIYASRKHFLGICKRFFASEESLDDSGKAMSYRTTILALLGGDIISDRFLPSGGNINNGYLCFFHSFLPDFFRHNADAGRTWCSSP